MNKFPTQAMLLDKEKVSTHCVLEYAEQKIHMHEDEEYHSSNYVFYIQRTLQLLVKGSGVQLLIPLNSVFYLKDQRYVWRRESSAAMPLRKWQLNLISQDSCSFNTKKHGQRRFSKIFYRFFFLSIPLLFCIALCIILSKDRSVSKRNRNQTVLKQFLTAAYINKITKQNSENLPEKHSQILARSHTNCNSKCLPSPMPHPSQKREFQTTKSVLE